MNVSNPTWKILLVNISVDLEMANQQVINSVHETDTGEDLRERNQHVSFVQRLQHFP
jgi:hypothetical protein